MAKQMTGQPLRSAERLLEVLKSFSTEKPARTTAEISQELKLATSTVRRLLQALERHGFVHCDERTGRFTPHFQVLRLAAVALATNDITKAVAKPADWLARETGETVQVAVLDGLDVVHIDGRESTHTWKIFHPVGHRHRSFPGSALGKVLLAALPREEVAQKLPDERSWPRTNRNSAHGKRAFLEELARVAARGYAFNESETEPDVWAVAAPVHDYTGKVVAAINVPCPTGRVSDDSRKEQLVLATLHAAAQTSEALGFHKTVERP